MKPSLSENTEDPKEALNKSHMSRVAEKIEMVARSATQVVAGSTMPRSAPKQALDFNATLSGRGFAGDPSCSSGITCFADEPTLALKRRSICEGNDHSLRLASRVSSPKADRHGHAGLVQGFPNIIPPSLREKPSNTTSRLPSPGWH